MYENIIDVLRLKTIIVLLLVIPAVSNAATVCTQNTRIAALYVRDGGWMHVKLQGLDDSDISNCGNHSSIGLLFNFNDATGTLEGKQMLLDVILEAKRSGDLVRLCSTGCDTQHTNYSRLTYIDVLQ